MTLLETKTPKNKALSVDDFGTMTPHLSTLKKAKLSFNENLRKMQFAIGGVVCAEAGKINEELKKVETRSNYNFSKILPCNIGNPQCVGQKPLTFFREVMSLVNSPHLLLNDDDGKSNQGKSKLDKLNTLFSPESVKEAQNILKLLPNGTGAYSAFQGAPFVRQSAADFIQRRDGFPSSADKIFLANGASTAIQLVMTMLLPNSSTGILLPVPQYPLYSALAELLGATQIPYFLKEEDNWGFNLTEVKRSLEIARKNGVYPRIFVLINPGNPTGVVYSKRQLRELAEFCRKEDLIIMADEVYQSNVYSNAREFTSMKKVVCELEVENAHLAEFKTKPYQTISLHSTSKGLLGECGKRGGYMEVYNLPTEAYELLHKLSAATQICPNVDGQVMLHLMLSNEFLPSSSENSNPKLIQEKEAIFKALKRKSEMMFKGLNSIEGVSCAAIDGAMYAFPSLDIPKRAIEEAQRLKIAADEMYCLSLLKATGISCVPGSGFAQEEGTWHLRITFLPGEDDLSHALKAFKKHHEEFVNTWA